MLRSETPDGSAYSLAIVDLDREQRLAALANAFVDGGRFVPGLAVDASGRGRSWWWPMPAPADRPQMLQLLEGSEIKDHQRLARELAELVDNEVRTRLVSSETRLTPRRSGRRTVPDSWLNSLSASDPWLPASLNTEGLVALERDVGEWVSSGVPSTGSVRLCLRLVAPETSESANEVRAMTPRLADSLVGVDNEGLDRSSDSSSWAVELLLQDAEDPSLIVSIARFWDGTAMLGDAGPEDVLRALGKLDRLAPELAGLFDQAQPVWSAIEPSTAVELLQDRLGLLNDAGIAVLLPTWWTQRKRVGIRMRTKRGLSAPEAVSSGGLGMDQIVAFRWEAALGGVTLTPDELKRLQGEAVAKRTVVRFRGEWVEITPGSLAAIAERIGGTHVATVADVLRASLGLGDIDAADDVHVTQAAASGWLGDLLDDALHATVEPAPTPEEFDGELRPYQERGVGWLGFLGRLGLGACLADDMGLGKTAQVIASILEGSDGAPTLVICPVSVLGNWKSELGRFAPSLTVLVHHGPGRHGEGESFADRAMSTDVVLTTYSLAARDVEDLSSVEWGRLVIDEAQAVKNPVAKQTKAVARLRANRRIALTGTPVQNNLSELWSIMHLLNPGLLGGAREFRRRFAVPIELEHDEQATNDLGSLTGPFILRRLKTDRSIIADLPDKIETTDHCLLTREQATLYKAIVEDLLDGADETEGIQRRGTVLAGLLKLKQVCNHPAHYLGDGSALAGRSGKLDRVEELLDELLSVGDKVLCFTQFRKWGDALQPYLEQRFGGETLWLHGGVPRKRRDDMVDRFEDPNGPRVFLISLRAGGTGLNLTAASHVIHLDRWWNPAVEDQATDRAYRIGQKRNVFVHKLVSAGTVEERIDRMIASKRDLAERVLGSGEEWLTELSTDELRELVALRTSDIDADAADPATSNKNPRVGVV